MLKGTETCSCATFHLPSILRKQTVARTQEIRGESAIPCRKQARDDGCWGAMEQKGPQSAKEGQTRMCTAGDP
jgi:hypothetical protein